MELPPIGNQRSAITNGVAPINVSLLSPTTKSPINRSPSIQHLGSPNDAARGVGRGLRVSPSMQALNVQFSPRSNENLTKSPSQASIGEHGRGTSLSMAPKNIKGLNRDSSLQLLSPREARNVRERNFSTVRGGGRPEISIQDMTGKKSQQFGVQNYTIPRPEPLLPLEKRRISLGRISKGKNLTFAEHVQAKKSWIPGPFRKQENWENLLPKKSGQFLKQPRHTEASEIMKNGQKVPGPSHYAADSWKKSAAFKKTLGNYKQKDLLITFAQESINTYGESPLIKYDPIQLNKVKQKPRYTVINDKLERFKTNNKEKNSPSCATYDVATAIQKGQWGAANKQTLGKSPKKSYFTEQAKKSISTGPAAYKVKEKAFEMTSNTSPLNRKHRH